MNKNDVLIRLRYALNITDLRVIELFALAGRDIGMAELEGIFKKEGEAGYIECGDSLAAEFLDGLVISRRGRRDGVAGDGRRGSGETPRLSNNEILKSIRIALELRDDDLVGILRLAGVEVSKSELSALFRKPGRANFRPCGDQFLRNFLVGLTAKYRV